MEKSNYKLFFYLGDKPININLKHVLNPQTNQSNETRHKKAHFNTVCFSISK